MTLSRPRSPKRPLAAAVLAAATAVAVAQTAATTVATPTVGQAWARPTVQGQAGGGGFMTITGGATADRLLSASAPVSKAVELHRMDMEGNVMRMREVDAVDVPAGQVVEFKPGGLHVMFIGLTQTLKRGATIPLKLRFEKAGEVEVRMEVRNEAAAGDGAHGAHGAHKH